MRNIFSGRSRPLTGWNRGQIAFNSHQFPVAAHSVYNAYRVSCQVLSTFKQSIDWIWWNVHHAHIGRIHLSINYNNILHDQPLTWKPLIVFMKVMYGHETDLELVEEWLMNDATGVNSIFNLFFFGNLFGFCRTATTPTSTRCRCWNVISCTQIKYVMSEKVIGSSLFSDLFHFQNECDIFFAQLPGSNELLFDFFTFACSLHIPFLILCLVLLTRKPSLIYYFFLLCVFLLFHKFHLFRVLSTWSGDLQFSMLQLVETYTCPSHAHTNLHPTATNLWLDQFSSSNGFAPAGITVRV